MDWKVVTRGSKKGKSNFLTQEKVPITLKNRFKIFEEKSVKSEKIECAFACGIFKYKEFKTKRKNFKKKSSHRKKSLKLGKIKRKTGKNSFYPQYTLNPTKTLTPAVPRTHPPKESTVTTRTSIGGYSPPPQHVNFL